MPFVLNVLDALAGDHRFLDIRKRRPQHRTLTRVDEHTAAAEQKIVEANERYQRRRKTCRKRGKRKLKKARRAAAAPDIDEQRMIVELKLKWEASSAAEQRRTRSNCGRRTNRRLTRTKAIWPVKCGKVQDGYKLRAVVLPPILPLVVAIFVFFTRRAREREGVALRDCDEN